MPGAGGEDAGAVLVWLLPLGITLMSGWQGKGNTGVKYRFQCLGSNFYKHPFLCVGPDLIPEVSQPRARFLAWKAQTVLVWHWPKSREGRSENQLPTPGPSLPSKKSHHEATLGGRECCLKFFTFMFFQKSSHSSYGGLLSIDKITFQNGWKIMCGYFEGGEQLCITFRKLWCLFLLIIFAINRFKLV